MSNGRSSKQLFTSLLFSAIWGTACVCVAYPACSQPAGAGSENQDMPRIVERDGRHALMVDGAPYLMLGAQINNSSAWPAMLPKVWPAVEAMHVNTVEMPVYWEQLEPQPDKFDFSVVDTLLKQAREHHVHLVLLWFGTWKNGSAHYLPEWMKLKPGKYPNIVNENGTPNDSPSPFAKATLAQDEHAFATLMAHLKAVDEQHTVLMVQVENEPGVWGSLRDFSPEANKLFDGPVPKRLLASLGKSSSPDADWSTVFGLNADDDFYAWYVARYIDKVAAAGKAVYPLPMYVNASLRDPLSPVKPGTYESGGATDNVLDIWKAAAPSIDVLAPDIYLSGSARYEKVLQLYSRPDNALFVPETSAVPQNARYFYMALGYGAIGFSPFGIDYTNYARSPLGAPALNPNTLAEFALDYKAIGPMDREVAKLNFEGKLQACAQQSDKPADTFSFRNWKAIVTYGRGRNFNGNNPPVSPHPLGRAMVAQLGPNRFLVTGAFCTVQFLPAGAYTGKAWSWLRVQEGSYVKGKFHEIRIWNGDQTDYGLNFSSAPQVLMVSLYTR